jgi:hypothetical protein
MGLNDMGDGPPEWDDEEVIYSAFLIWNEVSTFLTEWEQNFLDEFFSHDEDDYPPLTPKMREKMLEIWEDYEPIMHILRRR